MGWKGMLVGSYLGGVLGHLPGSLLGAILGHKVEDVLFGRRRRAPHSRLRDRDPLADAYATLGAHANDSTDDLRRKYRELAKRNHPDVLRAQGHSERAIEKATERMSRINAAWTAIREARGI